MRIKEIPKRLLNSLKGFRYRLGGSYLSEMSIPPGWNYQQYLQSYGQVGWLFGAVSLIAHSVADSQWHLFSVQNKQKQEIDDHPLLALLDHINPFQTGYQFRLLAQMYLSLVGECFIVLDYNQLGVPAQMWLAPPGFMHIIPDKEKYISHYEYRRFGLPIRLERAEVIHIMDPNPANPYRGLGTAFSIEADLDAERYASLYQRKLFFNDARPGLVVEIPNEPPPKEEREQLLAEWNKQYRGWGKAYSTAFLWGGAKINNVTMTNRDLDFGRLRKTTGDRILAAYHIPQSLMGLAEVGSRARAEADEYIFSKYTIRPALHRFKEAFNEQLCSLFDESLELDFEDPAPKDRASLVNEVERMVRAGIYTREFALQLLGYDIADLKGGTYLLPMNILPEKAKSIPIAQKSLTENQKEAHWRAYARTTEGEERPFRRLLKQLFSRQQGEVIDNLHKTGNADFNETEANEYFASAVAPILQGVYENHFIQALEGQKPEPAHTESKQQEFLSLRALEWLKTHSLSLAKMVNGTTKEQLREALAEGFQMGEAMDKITDRIKDFYRNGYEWRAPIVARTEVITASAEGTREGYEDLGVKQVEFYAALDERQCLDCEALHEKLYPLGETAGIIPVHPNCRCVWLPVI